MAIYKNRVNTPNYFKNFKNIITYLYKRFRSILLIFIAAFILHLNPIKIISDISLELNGRVLSTFYYVYDGILFPINFLYKKIAMLSDIETQNIYLHNQIMTLESLQTRYDLLKAENEVLREILNIIPDNEFSITKARLLSISLNPFNKTLLIGAGKLNGIYEDQIVTSEAGLIGRIVQTNDNYAKVMLINDANSRVPVITSITGVRAILGAENNKLVLLYLQNNHKINKGEIIVTSGDGKIYPHGLPVGKVAGVNADNIEIEPLAKLNHIEFVNILH